MRLPRRRTRAAAAGTRPREPQVNFTGLPLNTKIYYVVGDAATGVSAEVSFTSSPGVGPIYPYTTAFIADIGEADSANDTITRLLETLDKFDSVVIK